MGAAAAAGASMERQVGKMYRPGVCVCVWGGGGGLAEGTASGSSWGVYGEAGACGGPARLVCPAGGGPLVGTESEKGSGTVSKGGGGGSSILFVASVHEA